MKTVRQKVYGLLALVVCVLASCSREERNLAEYCQVGLGRDQRIYFDLDSNIARSFDTSSPLEPIYRGPYYGFIDPFPLLVPTREAMRSGASLRWEADGYRFEAIAPHADSEWILVSATPSSDRPVDLVSVRTSITLLYSWSSGVLAFRRTSNVEGEVFSAEIYSCSDRRLLLTDLGE